MSDQLSLRSVVFRLTLLGAALAIAAQVAIVPAAAAPVAAPAHDDAELTVTPSHDEGDAAAEPEHETDEAVAEDETGPAPDADEPAAEPVHAEDDPAFEPVQADATTDEPAQPEEEMAAEPAPEVHEAAVAPAPVVDEVDDAFLRRLLDAINARRDRNGTRRLTFIPASANAALDGYLAETMSVISWPGPCGHQLVGGASSWDVVQAAGFGGAPRGEVLACPGPEPYWTPDRTAARWWDSPIHFDVLYADRDASSIACSAYGVRGGSRGAASAVLCVTFRS
jgi:hypothetical protein